MSDIDQLYQDIIIDHSKKRYGSDLESVQEPQGVYGQIHELNPSCGDEVTLRVEIEDGKIKEIHWSGQGCSISQAATSVVSQLAPGMTLEQFQEVMDHYRQLLRSRGKMEPDEELLGDGIAFAGVSKFSARVKCAMLGWVATESAIEEAETKLQE